MSTSFQPLSLIKYPIVQDHETSENKYWKSFALTSEEILQGGPNTIHFNPNNNTEFIVTASTKVHLYDSHTDKVIKSFSRFKDDAFCGKSVL